MTEAKTGRASQSGALLADEWAMCQELARSHPGPGEWVPWRALVVRPEVNPRSGAHVDFERVREYASVFYDLPPVTVQRDTFVLIDGNHRLMATSEKGVTTVGIRITEVDVPDDGLREAAFAANCAHGVQLTVKERTAHLRYLLDKHGDEAQDADLARQCGLSAWTVGEHRRRLFGRRRPEYAAHSGAQDVTPIDTGDDSDTGNKGYFSDSPRESVVTSANLETQLNGVRIETETEDEDGETALFPAAPGNVAGGKPAGYFAVGALVADMEDETLYRVRTKQGARALLENLDDGATISVGLTGPMRYRAVTRDEQDGEEAARGAQKGPRPLRRVTVDAVVVIREAIAALADAIDGIDVDTFVRALGKNEHRWVSGFSQPVVEWLAALVEAKP